MDTELLDTEVKARISAAQKERLRELASARHLKLADIIREALREKIESETAVPA